MDIVWTMPFSSATIEGGPDLQLRLGVMTVRCEDEDGQVAHLTFTGVAAFAFTEFGACSAEQLDSYEKVTARSASPMLDRVTSVLRDRALTHYRLFLDDVGCYDVIAAEFAPAE